RRHTRFSRDWSSDVCSADLDYYNSFVIQPMLIDVLLEVGHVYPEWERMREPVLARAERYAAVLERMISPEGAYPIIGRSIAYRRSEERRVGGESRDCLRGGW